MLYEESGMAFEYRYDRDAAGSYMALKLQKGAELLNHQVEIICQNPISAFVPFSIRRENEDTCIYYNITSKVSLAQYLERKRLNRKELLDLLRGITKGLMLYENYLLNLSGFVINTDFIYINPATAEISLIYVPVPFDRDTIALYRAFLKDLVVNWADVDDNADDNYLHRILNCLKSESFSLVSFNRLIADMRNSRSRYGAADKPVHRFSERAAERFADKNGSDPDCIIPDGNAAGKAVNIKITRSVILLQLLIVLAAVIACLLLLSRRSADIGSIAGVLIIAAAVDVLIMKRVWDRSGKKTVESRGNAERQREDRSYFRKETLNRRKTPYKGRHGEKYISPDVCKACDTIMISEAYPDNGPYLEGLGDYGGERIKINKDKFVIGRLSSMVDYAIQGNTVGKLHAEISVIGGSYFIKDLNSKNGTYINGLRISSNKEYEIRNNDRVKFSCHEFVFRQQ